MLQERLHATYRKVEIEKNEGKVIFIQNKRDKVLRFRLNDPENAERSRHALGQGNPEAAAKCVQSS